MSGPSSLLDLPSHWRTLVAAWSFGSMLIACWASDSASPDPSSPSRTPSLPAANGVRVSLPSRGASEVVLADRLPYLLVGSDRRSADTGSSAACAWQTGQKAAAATTTVIFRRKLLLRAIETRCGGGQSHSGCGACTCGTWGHGGYATVLRRNWESKRNKKVSRTKTVDYSDANDLTAPAPVFWLVYSLPIADGAAQSVALVWARLAYVKWVHCMGEFSIYSGIASAPETAAK